MSKEKLKCSRCKSGNLVKGDRKVYAEYCGDCGKLIRVISIELLDKHKNWWKNKEALARLMGKKAWKPNRYPFCGYKFDTNGKRIEKCGKHGGGAG